MRRRRRTTRGRGRAAARRVKERYLSTSKLRSASRRSIASGCRAKGPIGSIEPNSSEGGSELCTLLGDEKRKESTGDLPILFKYRLLC